MALHRSDVVSSALLVAAALAGVALWNDLPAEMAIHFDAGGTPDSYVPRPVGVLLAPAIGLGSVAFARLAISADPSADARVGDGAIYFVGAVVAYVQGLVLAYNLGYEFPMTVALVPVLAAAAALVGWAVYREHIR